MNTKAEVLAEVQAEFQRWETLLAGLSEAEITAPIQDKNWGVHDIVAHLYAWQQLSVARLEAGLAERDPDYPAWYDAEAEENVDAINAGTYTTYHHRPWAEVYQLWRDGFLHFIALGDSIPEEILVDKARFAWIEGYSLADVMHYSYEHHHIDHLEPLQALLQERAQTN